MKLIRPSYQILTPLDRGAILKAIEAAGRTCYKSEGKITPESGGDFLGMITNRGHLSVIEHQSFSVRFICDRGVSHELVRHRLASFSQESTRYCNYSKDKFDKQLTFIIPEWLDFAAGEGMASNFGLSTHEGILWLHAMQNAEEAYNNLTGGVNPKTGNPDGRIKKWKPEQARSVLPNSLKTEIVLTTNLRIGRRSSDRGPPRRRTLK